MRVVYWNEESNSFVFVSLLLKMFKGGGVGGYMNIDVGIKIE